MSCFDRLFYSGITLPCGFDQNRDFTSCFCFSLPSVNGNTTLQNIDAGSQLLINQYFSKLFGARIIWEVGQNKQNLRRSSHFFVVLGVAVPAGRLKFL